MIASLRPVAARAIVGVRRAGHAAHSEPRAPWWKFEGTPPPGLEGFELKARTLLPGDHHVVIANMLAWVGIYGTFKAYKFVSGGSEEVVFESSGSSSSSDGDIPEMHKDDSFDAWAAIPGNMEKWEAALIESCK